MRLLHILLPALILAAAAGAAADPVLPPGYVEEPEVAPEDPLPPMPDEFPPAPVGPVMTAPDAHGLLKACKEATFTDCFRLWRPPPLPPEDETREARQAPLPFDARIPRRKPEPGPLVGTPPAPDPAADQATYEALVRALKETGLEGKVLIPEPPKEGSTILELDPKQKTAPKK